MPYGKTDDTLEPCPFCASIDIRYSENEPDGYLFWCGNCGALGPNDVSFENAVKMWNLRRPVADLLAACEAAKEALRSLPLDALGFGVSSDGQFEWPIKSELENDLTAAIARARWEGE